MNNLMQNIYPQNQFKYPYSYTPRPTTTTNNGIIWVQGLEGAKAYQLMPNSNCALFDSENEGIAYIKTSDEIGMCNLRTLKYEEISPTTTPTVDTSQFVTRAELDSIIKELKESRDEQPLSVVKSSSSKSKQ